MAAHRTAYACIITIDGVSPNEAHRELSDNAIRSIKLTVGSVPQIVQVRDVNRRGVRIIHNLNPANYRQHRDELKANVLAALQGCVDARRFPHLRRGTKISITVGPSVMFDHEL